MKKSNRNFLGWSIQYGAEKSEILMRDRGISLEMVKEKLEKWEIYDIVNHPNQEKYPWQEIAYIPLNGYICAVPYIKAEESIIFIKTAFYDRKANKKYF